MNNRAWMPLHIADYLSDTGHLSASEHGAYLLLIMHYWQNGSLPADERLIARIARLDAQQWAQSRDVLAMFFGENWTHRRIEAELAKADEVIEKRRAAAEAKHKRSKADAHAVHMHSKCTDTRVPPSTNKPSSSLRSDDRRTPAGELEAVLDADRSKAVIDHRQRMRRPLTAHAARLLADKFAQCPDPNAAADAMIANGWQGFEPEWLERPAARGSPPERPRSTLDAVNALKARMTDADRSDQNPQPDQPLALGFSRDGQRRSG